MFVYCKRNGGCLQKVKEIYVNWHFILFTSDDQRSERTVLYVPGNTSGILEKDVTDAICNHTDIIMLPYHEYDAEKYIRDTGKVSPYPYEKYSDDE